MNCKVCGEMLPYNAKFCPKCGAANVNEPKITINPTQTTAPKYEFLNPNLRQMNTNTPRKKMEIGKKLLIGFAVVMAIAVINRIGAGNNSKNETEKPLSGNTEVMEEEKALAPEANQSKVIEAVPNEVKNTINSPYSSSEVRTKTYYEVADLLKDAGFTNIETTVFEDLSSTDNRQDGAMEAVTINGENSFTTETEFEKNNKVLISYHIIPRVKVPEEQTAMRNIDY